MPMNHAFLKAKLNINSEDMFSQHWLTTTSVTATDMGAGLLHSSSSEVRLARLIYTAVHDL